MKKRPFLMAVLLTGGIFLLFLTFILAIFGNRHGKTPLGISDKVGVVEIAGVITSSKTIIEQLEDFRKDSSIKAIVLRVDSPGGGVGPSQEIHREVVKIVDEKPLVVSMGSVAASGGYYVSASANRILANPGTITGSIGVLMEFTNFEELLDKIGLKSQVIKSGEHKDIGSPTRPMTKEDRKLLQTLIDDVHEQFVAAVSEGRGLLPEKVRALADGRIFTGRQAMEVGLVDELGNLQDAVSVAASLAGISGEPKVIYPPKKKSSLIEYLVEEVGSQLRRGLQESSAVGLHFILPGV